MGKWFAVTWEGTVIKSLLGALLGALGSWLVTSELHPLVIALGMAATPVLLNAINGRDPRYGKGAQPHPDDVATAHEFEIEGE